MKEIAYEETGVLTVCPMCGGSDIPWPEAYVCQTCWLRHGGAFLNDQKSSSDTCEARRWFHDLGVRLRAEGKLPALKNAEVQKWGVYYHAGRREGWSAGRDGKPAVFDSAIDAASYADELRSGYPDLAVSVIGYPPPTTEEPKKAEPEEWGYWQVCPDGYARWNKRGSRADAEALREAATGLDDLPSWWRIRRRGRTKLSREIATWSPAS